jgi:hypothetical protein
MKKLLTGIALCFCTIAFAQTKQQRTVGDFTAVSGATGIHVELTQGNENAVWVSASDDKYLPNIKTVVENGMLKIYYDNTEKLTEKNKNWKLNVFVTYKSINKISGSSGSMITAKNTVNGSDLSLDISSGAEFSGELKVTGLKVDLSSGAMSKVTGSAVDVKAEVSSGGILTGSDLSTETCKASASTGGIIKIGVSKKLDAHASTGGAVNYKGSPEVEKSTSLGGVVSKI